MWQLQGGKRGELLLQVKHETTNIESIMLQKKVGESSNLFTKEIRKAQFYYQDLLMCVASGNVLGFYAYEMVDPKLKDDVKRLQSKGNPPIALP